MRYLTVIGAYGRDYTTAKAARSDWEANKDFQIVTFGPDDGRYISKTEAAHEAGLKIMIRYRRLTQIARV